MEDLGRGHGDVFSFQLLGMGHVVMVSDPRLVKEIFTGDAGVLHAGEVARLLEPVVGRHSVLVLDESEHMTERRLLLPPSHGERVGEYEALIARIARDEIARWPIDEPFALHAECRRSPSR